MKFIIAFAAIVALAVASPLATEDGAATVLRSENHPNPDGSYTWQQELSNGIKQEETGELRQVQGAEAPVIVVRGLISYKNADGSETLLNYVADENGFQPQGAHLPTPPPASA